MPTNTTYTCETPPDTADEDRAARAQHASEQVNTGSEHTHPGRPIALPLRRNGPSHLDSTTPQNRSPSSSRNKR